VVALAGWFRAPFARYWLSGFLADFGDGVRLAFITGVGAALRDTAAVAFVPRLADSADLDRANARVIAGQIVGNELAGPAAGSWLFGLAAVLPFAVNAGTLGIAVLLLLTLPGVFQPVGQPDRQESATSLAALRQELSEGLRWLRRHSDIRDTTVAVGVIAAMDAAWFAVLVLYVTQDLHQKPGVYGLLLAIGAVGGVAVGGIGPRITRRLGPWRPCCWPGWRRPSPRPCWGSALMWSSPLGCSLAAAQPLPCSA
jgi:hypothetical protein